MTTPRRLLVDPNNPLFYHLVSRCVRQAWLCGKHGQHDFSHRKTWLLERIEKLASCFALEVHAYAIMSNHFHLVVYLDPTEAANWSAEDVADRWLAACPPKASGGQVDIAMLDFLRDTLVADPARIQKLREKLSSLSVFMQLLKQPIARRANIEDGCQGHFFEKRFYSGALLDEQAVLAAMAYVDLNPIRAKLAQTLEDSKQTSIAERLRTGEFDLSLMPVVSGLKRSSPIFTLTLTDYMHRLSSIFSPQDVPTSTSIDPIARWRENVSLIHRPQRAFGSEIVLRDWLNKRDLRLREHPLF